MKAWKILALVTLGLLLLTVTFIGWYSWELLQDGFPMENILSCTTPKAEIYNYTVGQGSTLWGICAAEELGLVGVIFFGILTIISWVQARRRRNRL